MPSTGGQGRSLIAGRGLQVDGLAYTIKSLASFEKEAAEAVEGSLRFVGERVRADASTRFQTYSPKTADGYRVKVRARGVDVEQVLPRTTGRRGDWGVIQMRRALLPALDEQRDDTFRDVEAALTALARRY